MKTMPIIKVTCLRTRCDDIAISMSVLVAAKTTERAKDIGLHYIQKWASTTDPENNIDIILQPDECCLMGSIEIIDDNVGEFILSEVVQLDSVYIYNDNHIKMEEFKL